MDFKIEVENRVQWIKDILQKTGSKGVILGNSGGKDCSLVEILCRKATPNVLSVIMPCESSQNYGSDREHAYLVAKAFDIPTIEVDITRAKQELKKVIEPFAGNDVPMAYNNINPRLRMSVIYAIGQDTKAGHRTDSGPSEEKQGKANVGIMRPYSRLAV